MRREASLNINIKNLEMLIPFGKGVNSAQMRLKLQSGSVKRLVRAAASIHCRSSNELPVQSLQLAMSHRECLRIQQQTIIMLTDGLFFRKSNCFLKNINLMLELVSICICLCKRFGGGVNLLCTFLVNFQLQISDGEEAPSQLESLWYSETNINFYQTIEV